MREKKFRAWSTREKCWYSNFCLHKSGLFAVLWIPEEPQARWYTDKNMEEEGVVVMEYIGRLDHHDKEMCEGDIIEYIDNTSRGLVKKITIIRDIRHLPDFSCSKWEEIIGNIYENPEFEQVSTWQEW